MQAEDRGAKKWKTVLNTVKMTTDLLQDSETESAASMSQEEEM